MILPIVQYGDAVLRTSGAKISEITEDHRQLAADMIETMNAANGVGLAAQQIGKAIQMCVVDVSDVDDRPSSMSMAGIPVDLNAWMPMVLVNPELEFGKEKESGPEGCLSFDNITGPVVRPATIKCRTQLIDGREIEFEASGLLARAIQHEVDHLRGVLFIDRMDAVQKARMSGKLKRLLRKD